MLDSDSAIVSCETIMQVNEGVTIRRPLDGYRDRVAVWHLDLMLIQGHFRKLTIKVSELYVPSFC